MAGRALVVGRVGGLLSVCVSVVPLWAGGQVLRLVGQYRVEG